MADTLPVAAGWARGSRIFDRRQADFYAKTEKGKEKYGPARRFAHTGGCSLQRCEIEFPGGPGQEKQSHGGGERSGFTHGQHEITGPGIVFIFVLIIHEQVRENRHKFPRKTGTSRYRRRPGARQSKQKGDVAGAEASQAVTAQILFPLKLGVPVSSNNRNTFCRDSIGFLYRKNCFINLVIQNRPNTNVWIVHSGAYNRC